MTVVYTDVAIFDVGPLGARPIEMIDGLTIAELRNLTGVPLVA